MGAQGKGRQAAQAQRREVTMSGEREGVELGAALGPCQHFATLCVMIMLMYYYQNHVSKNLGWWSIEVETVTRLFFWGVGATG